MIWGESCAEIESIPRERRAPLLYDGMKSSSVGTSKCRAKTTREPDKPRSAFCYKLRQRSKSGPTLCMSRAPEEACSPTHAMCQSGSPSCIHDRATLGSIWRPERTEEIASGNDPLSFFLDGGHQKRLFLKNERFHVR